MIISFFSTKGGAGKSTLCCNAAAWLAGQGFRPVILDADSDQNSSARFCEIRDDRHPDRPPIYFEAWNDVDPGVRTTGRFREFIETLNADYDVVLVDLGGRDGKIGRQALIATDRVLIPVVPSAFDAWAASDTATIAAEAVKLSPELDVRAFLNRAQPVRTAGLNVAAERHLRNLPAVCFADTPISARNAFVYAAAEGLGITETRGFEAEKARDEFTRFARANLIGGL